MKRDRRHTGAGAVALQALALLILAMNVLIPPGFMPARADDESVVITLCTDHGLVLARLSADGRVTSVADGAGEGETPVTDHRSDCAFAGHAPISGPPAPLAAPGRTVRPVAAEPAYRPVFVLAGARMAAPPPPSHAPPLLTA